MKRIGCLCLAAAVLLSVTACGGSASSVSSSVPEVSSSSAETAEVSAVDFYDAFDEIIQDGEYGMHAKGITDNAKKFIADHDELFSQNKPLSGDDLGLLQENMDLRSVIKNQEKAGNALFNETGMVAMIQERSLGEDEEFTMGIIDCYNQPVGGQYCVFAYKGTVDALAGDDVSFTALPLCSGEVEQADGSTRTCVYIGCINMEKLDAAESNGTSASMENQSAASGSSVSVMDIPEVCQSVWPGSSYGPITYGEAVGYLLENDPGYEWYVNADNNSIDVEGSYITFNYTMGIADEPTICHFHLSFTKDSNGEWVPSYSGDECDSTDTFMECMYGYYYQGNQ